jgi:hypothetical protein
VDVHEILENLKSILEKMISKKQIEMIQTKSAEISLLNAFRILCRVISPTLIFGNLNMQKSSLFIRFSNFNIPIEHFTKQSNDS